MSSHVMHQPSAQADLSGPTQPDPTGHRTRWHDAECMLALVGVFLIALRTPLTHQVTAGEIVALATAPLWWSRLRDRRSSVLVVGVGLGAVVAGAGLTVWAASDHAIDNVLFFSTSATMVGTLASLGFLLWARTRMSEGVLCTVFGIGLLAGVSSSTGLFSSNPWRFGFSVPVIVLVLGLARVANNRLFALLAVAVFVVVSALTDARSSFAILLLAAALLVWQMRSAKTTRAGSGVRAVLGLVALAVAVYQLGLSLILSGYLGARTRQRSLEQIDQTGSLILGGRPELAATATMMKERIWGYGSGTLPNHQDVVVAKTGLTSLNYDPNNGYVENYMFGEGFRLHSMVGDLWASFGLLGVLFAITVLVILINSFAHRVTSRTATAIFLYCALKTLWNLAVGPWYTSIDLLLLFMVLAMTSDAEDRPSRSGDDRMVS